MTAGPGSEGWAAATPVDPGQGASRQRFDSRLEASKLVVVGALLIAGLFLRVLWALVRDGSGATGEAFNVARALAEGRGFADAYRVGQGPTAHFMPISPSIAGIVYGWFGIHSPAAETILTCWALALMLGTFLLVFFIFERIGLPLAARIGALAYLSLAPTYIAQEVVDFRIWEGGLAVFLSAANVYALVASEQAERISARRLALLATLAALLFFVNPILGIAGYLCAGAFALRRLSIRQTMMAALMAIVALGAFEVPWIMRNAEVMGKAIPLRSNGGLELAIGQNPRALMAGDQGQVFTERLKEIHPAVSASAYRRLEVVGGEAAYADQLGRETRAWIAENPLSAMQLCLRHLRQTFAPDPWQFGNGPLLGLRAFLAGLSGIIGLVALVLAALTRGQVWTYILITVVVPAIALSPFQPISRYTYVFYPWLTFCMAYAAAEVWSFRKRRFQLGEHRG